MVELIEAAQTFSLDLTSQHGLIKAALKHFSGGNDFYAGGEYEKAVSEYDAALAAVPDDPAFLNNKGAALGSLGHHEAALAAFDLSVALRPDYPVTLCNRGISFAKSSHPEKALADLMRAIELQPDYAEALSVGGAVLSQLRRYKDALELIDRALNLRPADADLLTLRRETLGAQLKHLAKKGFASWSGGKPKGSEPPIPVTPGRPVSDYVIEDRHR